MILICGIPSETPTEMVLNQLADLRAEHIVFNQRECEFVRLEIGVGEGDVEGALSIRERTIPLAEVEAIYVRLIDHRTIPEYQRVYTGSPLARHCDALHDLMVRLFEISPGRVMNRPSAMASNFSKPFQAQIAREFGFRVPETLITNDPALVVEFAARTQLIYKSVSGVRSIVRRFESDDVERLHQIRWCPTQFQEHIDGTDVRVHVVGDRIFATAVLSNVTDYRYASHEVNGVTELREHRVSDDLAASCVAMTASIGLEVAGIDLRISSDGEVFCFEINPSPAFSYYEGTTGQPIARAIARRLAGID